LESVFEKLEAAQAGQDRSLSWWKKAAELAMRSSFSESSKDNIIEREKGNLDDGNGVRYTPRVGTIVLFEYNAETTKQRLPYYDQLPVGVVLNRTSHHFHLANLHYISPKKRLKTLSALSQGKIDVPRKVIHKYKSEDVKNRLYIEIAETDWDSAIYMPIERFVSAAGSLEVPVKSDIVWFNNDPLTKFRFRAKRKIQ
tara:strand:+ start:12414 stop:13007 length:594 start_codon:yes stop_codon:yes gene_type:complete